jgi:hypothetical protein
MAAVDPDCTCTTWKPRSVSDDARGSFCATCGGWLKRPVRSGLRIEADRAAWNPAGQSVVDVSPVPHTRDRNARHESQRRDQALSTRTVPDREPAVEWSDPASVREYKRERQRQKRAAYHAAGRAWGGARR